MSFEKILLCWGSIESPFNIHKFYMCVPISLGAEVKTYVNKTKIWKSNKGEWNLDEMGYIILNGNVFFA